MNWKLYVITDAYLTKGRSHLDIARAAIAGKADIIQFRDKRASSLLLYQTAREIQRLARKASIPFIVNDRLDIALAINADGLHIGQEDLPAKVVRKLLGQEKILGISAGTLDEAIRAEKDGAHYLGVGPIYEARNTKPDTSAPKGLRLITQIKERCTIPVIAIGGINHHNVIDVFNAGADGVAIISAIACAPNIKTATQELHELICSIPKNQ